MREAFIRLARNTILLLMISASYLPLCYAFLFSFNYSSKKGTISGTSFYPSSKGYSLFSKHDFIEPFLNSLLISLLVSIIVSSLSLLTCFALWRKRHSISRGYVNLSSQIVMINPDIITAFSLLIFFLTVFGSLKATEDGLFRLILSYSVISLPYAIFTMLPRSQKFSPSLFEASLDLGFNRFRSWISTYLRHMLPAILFTFLICFVFTFDDFIVAKIVSNLTTLGTLLYQQQQIKTWILALGVFLLFGIIITNLLLIKREFGKDKNNIKKQEKKLYISLILILIFLIICFIILYFVGYFFDLRDLNVASDVEVN